MTSDGLLVLECLFDTIWSLFTDWTIPGTHVSPAEFFFFLAFAGLVLRWLSRLLELDLGLSALAGDTPRKMPDLQSGAPALGTRAWVSGDGKFRSHR